MNHDMIQIELWEIEMTRAEKLKKEAELFGDTSAAHYYSDRINWAKHKINSLKVS
ncbi:hypothetical protein [Chengkuizengella marina]|uniref:hypothetical protein n=1 Tax=Chengkuizengella marina TaxID=2507566 RepID=UPI001367AFCF|nr:hypothetical protein [Chengkuizengella marina]